MRCHRLFAVVTALVCISSGCESGSRGAAPAQPGTGGTPVQDPLLAALDLRLIRYADPGPVDAAAVIDQATYRQDLERTGFVPVDKLADTFELAWEINGINPGQHSAAKGSPAIVRTPFGPRIIVGGDAGLLYCFTADGTLAWSAYTHAAAQGIHGTPTVVDGVVYIGAYDGALYAFSLDSGALLFRTQIGGSIGSSPLVYDGKIYVSVETPKPSGIMAIVDMHTGEILWRDDGLRDHPHSSVALDPERSVMVVGDNSGDLTAWDLEPPRRRWVYQTGDAIKGPILLHEGVAFFGSWDKHLYAVDVETGEPRWRVDVGARAMSGAAISPSLGLVYMGSHDSYLYALNAETGDVAWSFKTGAKVVSSPVVAGDRVLFGSHDRYLYVLEAATGKLVYKFHARGAVSSSPALLGDRIVFTERRTEELPGSLYLLAPAGASR